MSSFSRERHGVGMLAGTKAGCPDFALFGSWGGEGRGEVGGAPSSEMRRVHLTLPRADARGPLPLPRKRAERGQAPEREKTQARCLQT